MGRIFGFINGVGIIPHSSLWLIYVIMQGVMSAWTVANRAGKEEVTMSKLLNPKAWYLVGAGALAVAADGARRLVRRRRKGQAEATTETTAKVAPAEPVVKEVSPEVASAKAAKTREAVAEKGQAAKARTPKAAKTAQTEAAAAVAKEVKAAGTEAKQSTEVVHDDLTAIKGIGPTFAKRLNEAGYSSYADIAMASADALREATHAPAVANPDEWIEAARDKI